MPNVLVTTMMAPLLRPSSVFMATTMETAFDHSCLVRSSLLGLLGVPPHWRSPQVPWIGQTGTPNLDPFFTSSFGHNFPTNDNQTFIVYIKSTLILFRKGLCSFFQFLGLP